MPDPDWSIEDRTLVLVDGAVAFDTADGRHLVGTATGEFVELTLEDTTWTMLRDVIDGTRSPADAIATVTGDRSRETMRAALDVLADEDVLRPPAEDATVEGWRLGPVAVMGATIVADALVDVLTRCGIPTRRHETIDPVPDLPGIVVACADRLLDDEWTALDRWCLRHEVAWHRCWRERATAWVGPLTVPGRSASYEDLRSRRLAASSWPDELEASWQHLAASRTGPAPLGPATAALLAATLAVDVVAYGRCPQAALPTGAVSWRGYDLRAGGGGWHRHPVLPLPVGVRR